MCLGRGEVRDRPLWQARQVIRHLDDGRELIGSGRVSVHSPHFVGNRYIFPHRLCFCLVIKATSGCLAVCKGWKGGRYKGGSWERERTETRRERGRKGGRKEEGREVQARKLGGKGQRQDGGKEEGEEKEKKEEKK